METCRIKLDQTYASEKGLIPLAGTYSYSSRKASVSFMKPEYYFCDSIRDRWSNKDLFSYLQRKTLKEINEFKTKPEQYRYYECLPSVTIDRFNTFEMLGWMTYSKKFTVIYSFHDKLDYILAGVYNNSVKTVRERLENNCKRFGLSYSHLSSAFCCVNTDDICDINLQVFLGVCPDLDAEIEQIFINMDRYVCNVRDSAISFANTDYSVEQCITIVLMSRIANFIQDHLNNIVMLFEQGVKPFIASSKCMLVSKGVYNIVITAANTDFPEIQFESGQNTTTIAPSTFESLGVNR